MVSSDRSTDIDSTGLQHRLESETSPLFLKRSLEIVLGKMGGPTSPIDIATPTGNGATSPASQNKTSNLTSALQGAGAGAGAGVGMPDLSGAVGSMSISQEQSHGFDPHMSVKSGRQESFSGGMSGMGSQWAGSGARPISMKNSNRDNREKPRRESLAGSLVGGMSWGGVSVGSWIRDDIIMAGTSPFAYQSPSYHSSSYLPKLEANFMRDFSCCGVTLPSLHDLLQHYEESHAQQAPNNVQRPPQAGQSSQPTSTPNTKAAIAAGAAASVQQQAQHQQNRQTPGTPNQPFSSQPTSSPGVGTSSMSGFGMMRQPPPNTAAGFIKTPLQTVQDMDTVEDMEMDDDVMGIPDANSTSTYQQGHDATNSQLSLGQRQQLSMAPSMPSLSLATSGFSSPHQAGRGLRTSQPTTPLSANQANPFQNNPTVSSVNTPTLTTPSLQQQLQQQQLQQQQQQQNTFSPESSVPGTPAEMEADMMANLEGGVPMPSNFGNLQGFGFGGGNDMSLDLCIDEPAKRLFSPNGFQNQQYAQFRLGGGQFPNESELGRRLKEQQMMAGMVGGGSNMMGGDEVKPFRCPVVGCEKAYKNQNGLKYHKTHGHTNQQLHENVDGTFSIVNPETSVPYPGTLGMEKEKPYRCEICGKRYKNLNGLKYHKAHSPPCNPDLKLGGGTPKPAPAAPAGVPAMGVNVAGAGLAGIGEEGALH